jgi:hypothetical protein
VTGLGIGVLYPGYVGHLVQPLFPLGTHVQVVLQELPQQLPAVDLELLLQFRVRPSRRCQSSNRAAAVSRAVRAIGTGRSDQA